VEEGSNMTKLLLTACALGLLFSPAFAEEKSPERIREEGNRIFAVEGLTKETVTRVVASGANERLGFFTTLNPDCTTKAIATVRVVKPPEHGKLDTAIGINYPNYSKDHSRYKCNQHRVKGVQVNYRPADKYVGEDAFDLLVIWPQGFAWELHYDISVR
jgi:hypothetical protein